MAEVKIDINEIMSLLPHRYPFLLIDKITELVPNEKIVAIKNVTANEPQFMGHFPGHPIMPGVLIVEAMAQAGGVLAFKSTDAEDKLVYFMGIDKAKFRKPVVPGDVLELTLEVTKARSAIWGFKGVARVDGKVVAQAELLATIVDK